MALAGLGGRTARSEKLCATIVNHAAWRRASVIGVFAPMPSEPDIELLWPAAQGKTLCYPTIRMGRLAFVSVSHVNSVKAGSRSFREPVFDPEFVVPPPEIDLLLVPGAAFCRDGRRLGRGGGFYDRFMSSPGFRASKMGVCFDLQILRELPVESHDIPVDQVVTESGIQIR